MRLHFISVACHLFLALTLTPAARAFDITLEVGKPANVSAAIYDSQGRMVRELARALPLPAGRQTLTWDGLDMDGRPAAAGDYEWRSLETQGLRSEYLAQTAAHLADHVIPPVPVRQWVISVPKRLRGMLADRPTAVAALTKIFLDEIERTLITASGVTAAADTPSAARPRLGGISFLHRFGSALNHHVHLHACVTDGVFRPAAADAGCDGPPAFLPARPITQADLAALTERVRRRVIRWFRLAGLLDAAAAADMLAWENSGFSVDAKRLARSMALPQRSS
ncbi:MAG: transposase, partial [Planctomycetia bacterium]